MGKRPEWIDCDGQHQRTAGGYEQCGVWGQRSGHPVAE